MTDYDYELKYAETPLRTLAVAIDADATAATIRHDDEKGIEPGDIIGIVAAETDEVVGKGVVTQVTETQVYRALDAIRRHGAIYNTRYIGELLTTLKHYYDGDEITPTSDVKVIFVNPESLHPDYRGWTDGDSQ